METVEIDNSTHQIENETSTPNEETPRRRAPGQIRTPPPSLPTSVTSIHPLLPPHTDDATLRNAFDIHVVHVTSSSKMEAKVRRVLSLLQREADPKSSDPEQKSMSKRPVLVALVARAPAANKCISITEIAKRELHKTKQKKWYQYTGFWARLEEMKLKTKEEDSYVTAQDSGISDVYEDSDRDDPFESVSGGIRPKVRNIPCLLVYLSTVPVKQLQSTYA